MKDFEFDLNKPVVASTELVSPKEQKKEKKYVGSVRLKKGLKIWKVSTLTLEAELVTTEAVPVIGKDGVASVRHAVIAQPGFLYVHAINAKNAVRKVKNKLQQK